MPDDGFGAGDCWSRRSLLAALPASAFVRPSIAKAEATPGVGRIGANLSAYARSVTGDRKAPGASVAAVLPGGRVVTAVAGFADPDRKLPVRPDTRFMSGSTGKTFCAATAMSLVGEKILDLDKPIAPLFRSEPWFGRLPNARHLTVRLLLMHAGGFPQFLDLTNFQRAYLWDAMRGRDTAYSPRKMLSFILDAAPLSPPGEKHDYSDLHYHLVGLTIERLTGRSYYDVLRERVITKLGTTDILPAVTRKLPRLAAGYARGDILSRLAGRNGKTIDDTGQLRAPPNLEYTGGGLALTPRALALFYHKLANGEVVAPALFDEMVRSSLVVPSAPGVTVRYGLGLFIADRPELGRYITHSGYYPGYSSNVGHFLDRGFSAAIQFNTDHGPEIFQALRDAAGAILKA